MREGNGGDRSVRGRERHANRQRYFARAAVSIANANAEVAHVGGDSVCSVIDERPHAARLREGANAG